LIKIINIVALLIVPLMMKFHGDSLAAPPPAVPAPAAVVAPAPAAASAPTADAASAPAAPAAPASAAK
jgi:K(+)-stimulated pyrophosphate-energized sodium pump